MTLCTTLLFHKTMLFKTESQMLILVVHVPVHVRP